MTPKSFLGWIASIALAVLMVLVIVPLVVVFCITLAFRNLSSEVTPTAVGERRVAVLELNGVILDSREFVDSLYKQANDTSVKGIIIRINSPGGSIGPSQEIYSVVEELKKKKPIVALMTGVAASGGLYSALGASKIFCQPGTLTGSIGVIMQLPNVQKIADLVGFQMTTVKSGALKDVGNAFRSMTAEEQTYLQTQIDAAHSQFVAAIAKSRNLPEEKVKSFADGRVILGAQAVELGLVDGIGDTYVAAASIFELLKDPLKENESADIFYPEDEYAWIKNLMNAASTVADKMRGTVQFQYILQ